MRQLSLFCAVAAVMLGWSVPASAVVTTSQVTVVSDGQPVAGATVTLSRPTPPPTAAKPAKPPRRPTTAKGSRTDRTGNIAVRIESTDDRSLEVVVTVRRGNRRFTGRTTLGDIADGRPISVTPSPSRSSPPRSASAPPPAAPPPAAPPSDGPTGPVVGVGLGGQGTGECPNYRTTRIQSITPDAIGPNATECFSEGFRGSVSLGYSWRVSNNWMAGVEVDVGFSDISKTVAGIPGTVGGVPGLTAAMAANDSVTVKRSSDYSLRARFGRFVTPTTVVYVTAGAAFQNIEATVSCTTGGVCGLAGTPAFTSTQSKTLSGWTLGGGVDTSLNDFLVGRVEYRYADYGTFSPSFQGPATTGFAANLDLSTHTILVGIGLKLGGMLR